MKARDLLRALEQYARSKWHTSDEMAREMPDENLKTAILVTAEVFKLLKAEAVRRGIWDELRKTKV